MNLSRMAAQFDTNTMMEFATKGSKFFMAQMNPFVSSDKKSEILNEFLGNLSKGTFDKVAPTLVMELQFDEKRAKKFKDSDAQVDAYIQRHPIMSPYRGMARERIREFRHKSKLVE